MGRPLGIMETSKHKRKYFSFWPLAGKVINHVQTLNKALNYIRDSEPTIEELSNWFIDTFPNVKKEKIARGYFNSMLRPSGLIKFDKKGITLSKRGKEYIENPGNKLLFQILDENVLGFNETVRLLGVRPHNKN